MSKIIGGYNPIRLDILTIEKKERERAALLCKMRPGRYDPGRSSVRLNVDI